MRNSWGSLVFGLGFGGVALFSMMAGCGADGARPEAGTEAVVEGGVLPGSGGTKSDGGEAGAAVPDTCVNTIKDGTETDVDCGGSVCGTCIDGKACIAKTDCAGGACTDGVCTTPACTDNKTDGDETDTDCGGSICSKCTIGKQCLASTDCVSGSCANTFCACPKGMVSVSLAGGNGAYCIDEIEVTKFQYFKFITANVPKDSQIDICKPPVNTQFEPRGAWPPLEVTPAVSGSTAKNFNLSLPVHYADWCDAYAYCKWANKQLCGSVKGGTVDITKADDATSDAWYNACSASGTKPYPYGTVYDGSLCNGGQGVPLSDGMSGPKPTYSGYGAGGANQDHGIYAPVNGDASGSYSLDSLPFPGCAGGVVGLHDMAGNVAEWEDACDGTTSTANCRVRGGSFLSGTTDANALKCNVQRTLPRVPPVPADPTADVLQDVGFRCCLY